MHKLGGAVSPTNPSYGPSELAYQLNDSGSVALVTSSSLLPVAMMAIEQVPAIQSHRIYLIDGDNSSSLKTIEQLIQDGRRMKEPLPSLNLAKGESKTRLALICYSSGTTGLPKGVMISHYNVISNVFQVALILKHFDDTRRDVTLMLLPLYHIYGKYHIPRRFALRC